MKTLDFTKTATVREAVGHAFSSGAQWARQNKHELAGAAGGALLATGLGALSVKRFKGRPSLMENDARELADAQAAEAKRLKERKKKPGYSHKLQGALSHAYRGTAKAMAEHPVAGSLTIGATGATLGWDLARLMKALSS